MSEKFLNDAIIGNEKIIASYNENGELLRLFYPNIGYKQYIDFFHVGVKINDSNIIYLNDDVNNSYSQYFTKSTNVLNTEIYNSYFSLRILQTDCVLIKKDVLLKKYVIKNESSMNQNISFLIHSSLMQKNISGEYKEGILLQYNNENIFNVFSDKSPLSYQINNVRENIQTGQIAGKDYIGMSSDSAISYDLGLIKPNEKKEIGIYLYIKSKEDFKNNAIKQEDLIKEIREIKKLNINNEIEKTEKYWINFVQKHTKIDFEKIYKNSLIKSRDIIENIKNIYERSILMLPLLVNKKTGGIVAAMEVDENKKRCGGYSYCWPRDGAQIVEALDLIGMEDLADKFFNSFCKNTQSENGMWEQRFFSNGSLAPCWGYQIDETAAVIIGVNNHYKATGNLKVLKDNINMCKKGMDFLIKYLRKIINKETMQLSYDIWEEREGIHTYSLASIYGAIDAMQEIEELYIKSFAHDSNIDKIEDFNDRLKIYKQMKKEIKDYIQNNLFDKTQKIYLRNNLDKKMDISLLSLVYPFKIFSANDKTMENTIEKINLTLRTYTGGFLRYEGDNYIGGNPWTISSLWMANYYIEKGEKIKAYENIEYVMKTASLHGYIAEQIDNKSLKPIWVNGLGWSHAMFITTIEKLYN